MTLLEQMRQDERDREAAWDELQPYTPTAPELWANKSLATLLENMVGARQPIWGTVYDKV